MIAIVFLAQDGVLGSPVTIGGLLIGAGGVIAYLFRLVMAAKDREYALLLKEKDHDNAELAEVKKSYAEIAKEAVRGYAETANFYRQREGLPPLMLPPAVISESHSPPTEKQKETAFIQTLRAGMARIKEEMGQTPRKEHNGGAHDEEIVPNSPTAVGDRAAVAEIKEEIAAVPEKTAARVMEKIEEAENKPPGGTDHVR